MKHWAKMGLVKALLCPSTTHWSHDINRTQLRCSYDDPEVILSAFNLGRIMAGMYLLVQSQ